MSKLHYKSPYHKTLIPSSPRAPLNFLTLPSSTPNTHTIQQKPIACIANCPSLSVPSYTPTSAGIHTTAITRPREISRKHTRKVAYHRFSSDFSRWLARARAFSSLALYALLIRPRTFLYVCCRDSSFVALCCLLFLNWRRRAAAAACVYFLQVQGTEAAWLNGDSCQYRGFFYNVYLVKVLDNWRQFI